MADMHASSRTTNRTRRAFLHGLSTTLPLATAVPCLAGDPADPQALFDKAVHLFFAGQPAESARAFDALVAARPAAEPGLWQRGLALYYAERFAAGRKQFELHRTVNPDDVENVAWHFACVARDDGAAAARAAMLPVGDDRRVPMRQILDFYAGRADAAAVLAAAEAGEGVVRRNQLCFAHLYLGLHAEAVGDRAAAKQHILLAAGPFAMDHFMGSVAGLHARLRGWLPPAPDRSVR
jgi:lipoprotein NlpI